MSKTNYDPVNANEGMQETLCTVLCQRAYANVYEADGTGYNWWTRGQDPNKVAFDHSLACVQYQIGTDFFGNPIYATAPTPRQADPLDYTDANGHKHYFIKHSYAFTCPTLYVSVRVS